MWIISLSTVILWVGYYSYFTHEETVLGRWMDTLKTTQLLDVEFVFFFQVILALLREICFYCCKNMILILLNNLYLIFIKLTHFFFKN